MGITCPLCNFAIKPHEEKKTLREMIDSRNVRPPFQGTGPNVHPICFHIGRGVKELIAKLKSEEQQPADSLFAT